MVGTDIGNLYVIEVAGHTLLQVTATQDENYSYPQWSPKGDRLAFVSTTLHPAGVWTLQLDGSGLSFVGAGVRAAWSPEGSRLALASTVRREERYVAQLTVIHTDDGNPSTMDIASANYVQILDASWSPGDDAIAVAMELRDVLDTPGQDVVFVADPRDGSVREVLRGPAAALSWLDPQHLVYRVPPPAGSDPATTELRLIDLRGDCMALILNEGPMGWPRLSPDGSRIAFIGSDDAAYVIDLFESFGVDFWQSGVPCG